MNWKAAVLTVSDRSSRGERPDEGGPLISALLQDAGYEVLRTAIVPDEQGGHRRGAADPHHRRNRLCSPGCNAGSNLLRLSAYDARHPGGHAGRLSCNHAPGHAVPGGGGHPRWDSDREPAGKPQGGQGESGGRSSHAGPRAANALRRSGGLCQINGLSKRSQRGSAEWAEPRLCPCQSPAGVL